MQVNSYYWVGTKQVTQYQTWIVFYSTDTLDHVFLISMTFFYCSIVDLKIHGFFTGFDWNNMNSMVPPFVPCPENDSDTSYFDGKFL